MDENDCKKCKLISPGLCLLLRLLSVGMADPPCVARNASDH